MEQDYRNSDEHIYENVVSVTRYKYNKIINGIFNSFTPKRDKIPSPLIHRSLHDDMSSCEFYENSYTSCSDDDNIYENLEFFDAYDDDNFLHNDCALDEWLRTLSREIDDYETDNYIFIKSIPSVLQSQCVSTRRIVSKSEITLNFLKSLWREDRVGMMSFLLETFSNLLRLQSQPQQTTVMESPLVKKSKKFSSFRRRKSYQQKLEFVILSSSLNALMITYNKSLKFYFALSQCETFSSRLSTGEVNLVEVLVTIRKLFQLKFATKSERREFYKRLEIILSHKLSEIDQLSETVALRENNNNCENIYQPIWNCQSSNSIDKRSCMMISENIYAQILTNECVADDQEWEIDDEFSFVNSMMIADKTIIDDMTANMTAVSSAYTTVWIFYSNENSQQNRIIYDHNLLMTRLNSQSSYNSQPNSPLSENKLLISSENMKLSPQTLKAVEVWKNDLRMPCNMEDEDDYLFDETFLNQSHYCRSDESFHIINGSNNSLDEKSEYGDAMSTLPPENELTPFKSIESFKSVNSIDDQGRRSPGSPRKGFKDKLKSKLGLNSSKSSHTVNTSNQSLNESTKSEDDDVERNRIFGCNLDLVEKDGYYKDIPRFVVECVRNLEFESNLRTSGIYRISGNKTIMDALKKKMNEKKSPKKESTKYFCLQDQDVHTLTGLLKTFFRELNPPLMSKEVFASCTSEKISASQMREKLKSMPKLNYELLKYLFKHFKSVEKYEKENGMNSGNIAICCGIGLFSGGDNVNPFENDIGKCNVLCKFLIDNYKEVFIQSSES